MRKINLAKAIGAIGAAVAGLTACGGGGDANSTSATSSIFDSSPTPVVVCPETGPYACKSGATEPLYKLAWHLNAAKSFFAAFSETSDGKTDINVESVHLQGIKGAGVKVLVLDDGMDIAHEDLAVNVDKTMLANFNFADFAHRDPTPTDVDAAHGTNVAGIIAGAQNGIGVMGIAPRATLGAAALIGGKYVNIIDAYGGADWSKNADIISASYGHDAKTPEQFDAGESDDAVALRKLPNLRGGKGLIFVKAAGNEFEQVVGKACLGFGDLQPISCQTTADDTAHLEPVIISTGAVNAKGIKASYSSAGAVNWISGLGGEYGREGQYGEIGSGPMIVSTDLSGCTNGYSRGYSAVPSPQNQFLTAGGATNVKDNPKCNYSQMNGTSAATPTVSGVVALMLSANPKLTWRDVREILRATARHIDPTYVQRESRNVKFDLTTAKATTDSSSTLVDGDTTARLDFGWVKNAAGYSFSNWYGFGLVDAAAAVKMAQSYTVYKDATLTLDAFKAVNTTPVAINYGHVQKIGSFTPAASATSSGKIDMLQLRLSGDVCVGRMGFYVKSPAGTVSVLSTPNNVYADTSNQLTKYGLGSFAFYGEPMTGTWEVYAVSVDGNAHCGDKPRGTTLSNIEYRLIAAK